MTTKANQNTGESIRICYRCCINFGVKGAKEPFNIHTIQTIVNDSRGFVQRSKEIDSFNSARSPTNNVTDIPNRKCAQKLYPIV